MTCSMGPESWSTQRQSFIFRCLDPLKGDRWTFVVHRATLEELHENTADTPEPTALFNEFRARIYSAAHRRMTTDADPTAQQVISPEDILRDAADAQPPSSASMRGRRYSRGE